MSGSSIPGFFKKSRDQRIRAVRDSAGVDVDETDLDGGIEYSQADRMVENAIGTFALPLAVATNFCINGRDYLVPMVIEESSVVAAASKAAKIARISGGFAASTEGSYSIGQIQIIGADVDAAASRISQARDEILQTANSKSRTLSSMDRGAKDVSCKVVRTDSEPFLIVELLIDVGDAMGANITNTMCEAVSPLVSELAGGRSLLRILSNYSTRRMVRATATFDRKTIGGQAVTDIISAYRFAKHDVYRAVTHNKGILNGIIAAANATGQDSRAIEAAAHAYAAHSGQYRSLSEWGMDGQENLTGTLYMPLSVGMVGGIVTVHPVAKKCMQILGVSSADELAGITASVGLAQNFAAMHALVTDGIQKGHMSLHARNVVVAAGIRPADADRIISQMIRDNNISVRHAQELARGMS